MPGDITTLLDRWKAGSAEAREELVSKTYGELRRLARSYLRRERQGHTLQATALLNEVYRGFYRRARGLLTVAKRSFA